MEKYAKICPWCAGLSLGILSALFVALLTLAAMYGVAGGFPVWVELMEGTYGFIGYSISWLGVLLGALYGFIDGFVLGALGSCLYNRLHK